MNNKVRITTPAVRENVKISAYAAAATQVASRNDGSVITEQTGEAFYDVETSTFYYRVMTVYVTGDGGYGAFFTFEKM